MAFDSRSVANFILDLGERQGHAITNMALNKILYFSHGWCLATLRQPLVTSSFEAWERGPVLPVIYHQFKRYGDLPISGRATRIDRQTGRDVEVGYSFEFDVESHLTSMVDFYAPKGGVTLSFMSHEPGAPWHRVRSEANQPGMVIPDEFIETYFATKLRSRRSDRNALQA